MRIPLTDEEILHPQEGYGIENGKVRVEDAETGRDLLTHLAIQQALHVAEEARRAAEARIAELEAQMRALKVNS